MIAGFYMYIEASLPQHPGNRARLISPSQPATSGSCLRFWYYMYGHTMGTLSVYLRSGGQLINTIFNISGNQGNRWIQAEITVHSSGSWEVCGFCLHIHLLTRNVNIVCVFSWFLEHLRILLDDIMLGPCPPSPKF